MTAISLLERPRHTDHLRLRDGGTLTVRFIDADEGEALQGYFRKLSVASRAGDYVVGATIAVDGGIVYANPGIKGGGWDS